MKKFKVEFLTFNKGAKLRNKSNFLFKLNRFANDRSTIYIRLFKRVGLYISFPSLQLG
jgi:hypothetical protein